MQAKKRLLVVGDYNRKDFLDAFYACKEDFDFYFIEFASADEITSDNYKTYGKAIFWKDYSDAFDLLEKIRPDKVVFYFIESYNQLALNVACKQVGIKTYHLDHGFRDLELEQKLLQTQKSISSKAGSKFSGFRQHLKKLGRFKIKLKNRLFFVGTVRKSEDQAKAFLKAYYQIRKTHSIRETFRLVNSPLRVAAEYISYSPRNFQELAIQDHLAKNYPVHYIGVPGFDKWAKTKPAAALKGNLVFVAQPFVEQGWLGWTAESEKKFIQELVNVCRQKKYTLFVKLHPYQNVTVWQDFEERNELVLLSEEALEKVIPETKVVAGFFSTLLIPLAALPHTTLITFENHPDNTVKPSDFLKKAGVSYEVKSVAELAEALTKQAELFERQKPNKASFASEWLFRLDGKSGERLKNILLA